jgi:hypothetical protein
MVNEVDDEQVETDAQSEDQSMSGKRQRSQIEFPYTDLQRAVELVRTLLNEGGQAKIEQTQLAVAMDQSASGGTFRGRLGAAKMFGLIGTELGKVWIERLGLRAMEEQHGAVAKAEAFLNIPLYKAMFDRYNGYALPPPAAIERQMEALGVPTKQKERARQAFIASALYANFIAANGRFSKPSFAGVAPPLVEIPEQAPADSINGGGGVGDGGGGGRGGEDPEIAKLHPFIKGLIGELPEPKTKWPVNQRRDWLLAASMMFKLIYEGDGTIKVDVVESSETKTATGM